MSDHNSGPRALADPVVDITDVYVFPSPQRPGVMVLVLDVFPNAGPPPCFPMPSTTDSGYGRSQSQAEPRLRLPSVTRSTY